MLQIYGTNCFFIHYQSLLRSENYLGLYFLNYRKFYKVYPLYNDVNSAFKMATMRRLHFAYILISESMYKKTFVQ